MAVAACHECDAHAVAVEGVHRVALCDEDRRLVGAVRLERVLARAFANEGAFEHLSALVETEGGVGDACEEVVPRQLLKNVDGEHLQRMRIEFQVAEDVLQRECLVRLSLEKRCQQLRQLPLVHPFSAFFCLSHSLLYLCCCKVTKYFVPLQTCFMNFLLIISF